MATTDGVKNLFNKHAFHQALIIDDAFDKHPDFATLVVADKNAGGAAIEGLTDDIKTALGAILAAEDLSEDDWEAGLGNEAFLTELWQLNVKKALPEPIVTMLFGVHVAETEQKLQQLAPLQALLKEQLKLNVTEVGREGRTLPANTKVVFLDLFLGVTGQAKAREEAADLIKELMGDMKDRDRPVVVLMSTETGAELEAWAADLRSRASLLGAKFRVISKSEFEKDGPLLDVLEDLLEPLDKAQKLAGLLDEWDVALGKMRADVMRDLRNMDLSDCAYLQKFRLDTEGMPLGSYLMEAYGDVVRYRLEGSLSLQAAAADVDNLKFDVVPPAHFLPSEGVTWLTHAMTFVNEDAIKSRGHQFEAAATVLELGDIIIPKPAGWADHGDLKLGDGTLVYAVISQACDLQQNKSDAVLLLQGTLRERTWNDSIKPVETRIDCFQFRGMDYVVEWEKAKIDAWQKPLASRRLKVGGTHLRIARLRPLPALKVQQIFASNLTRVGTLASPHMVFPVGFKVVVKDSTGAKKVLLEAVATDQLACIVKGLEGSKPTENQYLVFKDGFGKKLGEALLAVSGDLKEQVRPSVVGFAKSDVALARFRAPCKIGDKIEHEQLKIAVLRDEPENYTSVITIIAQAPVAKEIKAAA